MSIQLFKKHLFNTRKKNGEKLQPLSIERYITFITPHFEELESKSIDEKVEYMNMILIRKQSRVLYSAFMHYLQFCGVDTYEKSGVHTKVKIPRKHAVASNNKKVLQQKALSPEDIELFVDSQENIFWKCLYQSLYDTADRRSELLNITFKDITPMQPKNPYQRQMIEKGIYAHVNIIGKGGKKRVVVLRKKAFKLLLELHGTIWDDKKKVFEIKKGSGEPYKNQASALYDHMKKTSMKILGRHVHPHMFRHSLISHLGANNMNAQLIKGYSGHENIQMVEHYTSISSKESLEGMRDFAGTLPGGK
jgi:integrase